jgi:hypothetical protein
MPPVGIQVGIVDAMVEAGSTSYPGREIPTIALKIVPHGSEIEMSESLCI